LVKVRKINLYSSLFGFKTHPQPLPLILREGTIYLIITSLLPLS
jgi:hypothetical protein